MNHASFCNCSGEYQISCDFLIFDQRYNKYLNSIFSEVNYFTGKGENVDTLENQLLTIVKSVVKEY